MFRRIKQRIFPKFILKIKISNILSLISNFLHFFSFSGSICRSILHFPPVRCLILLFVIPFVLFIFTTQYCYRRHYRCKGTSKLPRNDKRPHIAAFIADIHVPMRSRIPYLTTAIFTFYFLLEPSAFISAHPRPKSIDFNPGSNDPENCTKFDSNSGRNYSVTAKFLTFQTFLNSNALRLFQPAMAEITVDPENDTQNPETEEVCLELDLELRYRSALYFVPKPIMGTEIELDYDAEDGSRLLAKRRLRARRNMSRREVEFDCSLFVRPGFYRLTVKGENEVCLEVSGSES